MQGNKLAAKLRSWWQKIRKPLIIAVTSALVVGVLTLIVYGYLLRWNWTGFSTKTLWDWMQLLIIPVVLAVGGFWLNQIQKSREERHAAALETDRQRQAMLQEYLSNMSELLLEKKLRTSQPGDEVRNLARLQTLMMLPRLDGVRKRSVLQFLKESGLIDKDNRIVELHGADFWQADLRWINLENAHLGGALCWKVDFSEARLNGAYLGGIQFREVTWNGADLSKAYLGGAMFLDADGKPRKVTPDIIIAELKEQGVSLQGVELRKLSPGAEFQGATMPDGSTPP